jgi:hypothetical protein
MAAMRALLPLAMAVTIYLPTLGHGFVWDDRDMLLHNAWYADMHRWAQVLHSPLIFNDNYFRPLGLLWLGAEARAFSSQAWGFHLVSVLLHALATWLVWLIGARVPMAGRHAGSQPAERWWQDGALVSAVVYAVHPALVEGVSFVSARFDGLVTVFLLLALLADQRIASTGRRAMTVGACFFAALACKEMALGLVLVLPCVHLAVPREQHVPRLAGNWRSRLGLHRASYAALGVALLGHLAWRHHALGALFDPSAGSRAGFSLAATVDAVSRGVQLMLWPLGDLAPLQLPLPGARSMATQSIYLALAFILCGVVIRRGVRVAWWWVAACVALVPVSQPWLAVMADDAVMAERFLLFPVAVLCVAVARCWPRSPPRLLVVLTGMWCGAAIFTVAVTSRYWQHDLSLWTWATTASPLAATAWTNLSSAQMARGKVAEAERSAARAIDLDPGASMAWNNRGITRLGTSRFAAAQADFEAALAHGPDNVRAANNLAISLMAQKRFTAAERTLRTRSLRIDPNDPYAHLILGELSFGQGKLRATIAHLEAGLRTVPASDQAAVKSARQLLARARRRLAATRGPQ